MAKKQKKKSSAAPQSQPGSSAPAPVFPLLDLPLELRWHIYDLVFASTTVCLARGGFIEGNPYLVTEPKPRGSSSPHALALLFVCRQIRAEIGGRWPPQVLFHWSEPLEQGALSDEPPGSVRLTAQDLRFGTGFCNVRFDVHHLNYVPLGPGSNQVHPCGRLGTILRVKTLKVLAFDFDHSSCALAPTHAGVITQDIVTILWDENRVRWADSAKKLMTDFCSFEELHVTLPKRYQAVQFVSLIWDDLGEPGEGQHHSRYVPNVWIHRGKSKSWKKWELPFLPGTDEADRKPRRIHEGSVRGGETLVVFKGMQRRNSEAGVDNTRFDPQRHLSLPNEVDT
ncbi:MAG: hypothetical protein M1831_001663 [Alyxoria varia]|nr:MAG: hypothetical protein M1831_001663 [Alyxoria varia]